MSTNFNNVQFVLQTALYGKMPTGDEIRLALNSLAEIQRVQGVMEEKILELRKQKEKQHG